LENSELWLVGARVKLVATSKSERDNYLDGEWQKASRECDYAMGQRAAGLLVDVVDSGEVTHQNS